MLALEVKGLKKSFGKTVVIKEVTFEVEKGRALGFVGRNGAGKTTTMKIIMGLLSKDGGDIYLAGKRLEKNFNYQGIRVGYLPDVPEFYNYLKPKEYLKLCGEIMGLEKKVIEVEIKELLELFELTKADKKIGSFSRGMKQRLGMAQAMLGKPDLLLCDEPTSALDPIGRHDILELMKKIKTRTTIVFSTHVLSDVEEVCDDVAVLHEGRILYWGDMDKLKGSSKRPILVVELDLKADKESFIEFLQARNNRYELLESEIKISLPEKTEESQIVMDEIWNYILNNKLMIKKYLQEKASLEDVFMEMTL
ncbi:MAG: ABC transporter ATP-binding protein [Fusobacteria bacterium]|nr:ABC transporter ATP-binding protein [Fusobacteriota bacterium]